MKAITLKQPFASLVSIGAKTIETCTWSTNYRGPLAIHSGGFIIPRIDSYSLSLLIAAGLDCERLPFEKIIAVARLVSCEKVITSEIPCYPQLAFSNFTPGRYALGLADILPLATPIPAKGDSELWDWDGDLPEEFFY
jgi:hypothetical protein